MSCLMSTGLILECGFLLSEKKHQGDGVEKYEKPVSPPKLAKEKKGYGEKLCVIFLSRNEQGKSRWWF